MLRELEVGSDGAVLKGVRLLYLITEFSGLTGHSSLVDEVTETGRETGCWDEMAL